MRIITAWLTDVYQHYGYVAVLISIAVLVVLIGAFCYVFGISPVDMAKWLGGQ